MRNFSLIFIVFLCASRPQMVVSAPSEHTKKDFKSTFESNEKKDVPLIFRCSFQVVDDQMKGNESLLEIWNEYKPFLEFLTGKVEACIEKYGESEAKGCYIKRGLLFGAIIDELSERIRNVSPETQKSLDRLVKQKCIQ